MAALAALVWLAGVPAQADSTPQALPFSQNWTNPGLITANDNWSGVPGIQGFLGDDGSTTTAGVDPQTVLVPNATIDVIAQALTTSTTGGVGEFETVNTVGIQGSGGADFPHLVFYLVTTGSSGVTVHYNLRDIDGTLDNAVQPIALQFRVGNSGNFTNVPAGFVADATTGPSQATKVTGVCAVLDATADNQPEVQVRVLTWNAAGSDEWVGIDDIVVDAAGCPPPVVPTCPTTLTTTFGGATSGPISATDADGTVTTATITGITPSDPGTITITGFTPAAGVGGTANGTLSVSAATPVGSYNTTIQWANNDPVPQTANCLVAISVNTPPTMALVSDVQGSGATTPIPGTNVTVDAIVTGSFQGSTKLQGFFVQEEDAQADGNPATSDGVFIFCGACPTPVSEGDRVQATGLVSEFNGMTEITASAAGSVVVVSPGHLAEVTPSTITLPVAGVVDDFYEAREGMLVSYADTLTVSEYFELVRFGQIVLFQGSRPFNFTETSAPNAAGYSAHLDGLARRQVILDDDNNAQEAYLASPNGSQAIFYPRANGGFSVGTQGTDFFRGGDVVNGLTGILQWGFPGFGANTWRIRPTIAHPVTFTVANPRPATPPAVGGAIKAVSMNLLNYFTTIDTTSSNTSGPCGPSMTQDCRGADSVAELARQRERASVVICSLNADVYGLMELENTTASATITDLLGAVNARCGGANPYAAVGTASTLGTDAIRVQIIYRSGILSPVGATLFDTDPIHNRPPTAQTFDVVDATNPAFGQRFTVIANHFKSKGCSGATGLDLDQGDGQACYAFRRTQQATRLLTWINDTVIPAAGDPDVLLLGDFNSYGLETPITTLTSGGYTDVESALLGSSAYSYLFSAQLGHLDYALANASLFSQVTGVGAWHINADEADVFDYNDEIRDTGEATFEEKPDGSALAPPRVAFQAATAVRASDHDPILLGLFPVADLSVSMLDAPDPVIGLGNLMYIITVANAGPSAASGVSVVHTLPASVTFSNLTAAGWSCSAGVGTVTCSRPSLASGASALFYVEVTVGPAGATLNSSATVSASSNDPNAANNSISEQTTVIGVPYANLAVALDDGGVTPLWGGALTYTVTVTNGGPDAVTGATLSDSFPVGLTGIAWTCTASLGSCAPTGSGNINDTSVALLSGGTATYTATGVVLNGTTGPLVNTATVSSSIYDPVSANNSATINTPVNADLIFKDGFQGTP